LSADISLHLGAWRTSAHGAFRQTFRSGTWRTSTPHGFNSTACDFEAFPAAFPNLQAHRLSSREWTPPLLSEVGHETMYRRALSQLAKFDVVGGTSQLDRWMQARAPAFSPVARSPFRPSLTHMTSLCSWSVLSPALRLAQHSSKSMTRSAGGWHVTVSHHLPRQHGA
jgi:hypothetical protein